MKFGRKYTLAVQVGEVGTKENVVTIQDPLTLILNVRRGTFATAATATFEVYNLSKESRARILHDRGDFSRFRQVTLAAGYESDKILPVIFKGNIAFAASRRSGPDWITYIEAYSGFFAMKNGHVSLSLPNGYNINASIEQVVSLLPNVTIGGIGDFKQPADARGIALSGNAWDELQKLLPDNAAAFIDNERVYVLSEDEYVPHGDLFDISPATGLLGSPLRTLARLDVTTIFEPRIALGSLTNLKTEEGFFDGRYVVSGVTHVGSISGATAEPLLTTTTLWDGAGKPLRVVRPRG